MLYLDRGDTEFKIAKLNHWEYISHRITKKVTGKNCNAGCAICQSTKARRNNKKSIFFDDLKSIIVNDNFLKKIILGLPDELLDIEEEVIKKVLPSTKMLDYNNYLESRQNGKHIASPEITAFINDIEAIFDYDWFVGLSPTNDYSGYHLADSLNVRSCTYCNRSYTSTMRSQDGGKLMRPQFDHWFPKSKYPLLALSFYNLIPSCYICNSLVKGDLVLDLEKHIHPYVDSKQSEDFLFYYQYQESLDRYEILVKPKDSKNVKAHDTIRKLKIDTMYNAHFDELDDLIKIKKAYSGSYIEKLQQLFPESGLDYNEVYRLLFGAELDFENFHKRPLSKFKRDILKQLGIISS